MYGIIGEVANCGGAVCGRCAGCAERETAQLVEEMIRGAKSVLAGGAGEVGDHGTWRVNERGSLEFLSYLAKVSVHRKAEGWEWEWLDREGDTGTDHKDHPDLDDALRAAAAFHAEGAIYELYYMAEMKARRAEYGALKAAELKYWLEY